MENEQCDSKTQLDPAKQVTLEQWLNGSTKQRGKWLHEGHHLDPSGSQILGWAQAFQRHGALIHDGALLAVWRSNQLPTS